VKQKGRRQKLHPCGSLLSVLFNLHGEIVRVEYARTVPRTAIARTCLILFFAVFMVSRRIEVFFYGLFMDADLLRTKGADPLNIRPACVPGFALRIGQRATLLRIPDARAHGILMELTHGEIEQLYSEPSVRAYRPEAVLAELSDGSRIPALCFNLPVPPGPEEVNSEYAAKLRDLARRLGLPSDYVESIQ
jgi:hypothetical protein